MFAHSRGHVFCRRGTTQIAENFSPQSIGTGEHLSNDGIDDGQVSRSGLVIGEKLRPTVAHIDSLAPAIDELIPAKYRGRVDIAVNGTYWGGALIGTMLTLLVVNHLPVSYSWRVAFLFGPVLGVVILFVRKNLPESPRWLTDARAGTRRPRRRSSGSSRPPRSRAERSVR